MVVRAPGRTRRGRLPGAFGPRRGGERSEPPLRHTGDTLAADMGISLRNLMARMGHDNERAALIYQHKSSAADRQIADGLDELLKATEPAS